MFKRISSYRRTGASNEEEPTSDVDSRKSRDVSVLDERRITSSPSSSKKTEPAESRDDDPWMCFGHLNCGETENAVIEEEFEEIPTGESSNWSGKTIDMGQKRVVYESFGDTPSDVMYLEASNRIPKPSSPADVVIKVEASTVSLNDCLIRRGLLESVSLPVTPGYDVVGRVFSCGDAAKSFDINEGDRVAALVKIGGNARYAVVKAENLVKIPNSVRAVDAACLVSVYMTAYQSLKMIMPKPTEVKSKKKPLNGRKVLITGGAGPVGQALIRLCNNAGASVFTTVPAVHQRFVKTSFDAKVLPAEPPLWIQSTKGKMDIVFDSQCQDGYKTPKEALVEGGTLVCIGMTSLLYSQQHDGFFGAQLSSYLTGTQANYLMSNTKTFNLWESFQNNPDQFKKDLKGLIKLLQRHDISPNVVKKVALSQVGNAQLYIEHGKARGIIVCEPWKKAPKQKRLYG